VLPELPPPVAGRSFYTCTLADRCAKGGYGHTYWLPRTVLPKVSAYLEGARARAVRKAQDAGRYDAVPGAVIVNAAGNGRSVSMPDGDGGYVDRPWNLIGPAVRRRLFRETAADEGCAEPVCRTPGDRPGRTAVRATTWGAHECAVGVLPVGYRRKLRHGTAFHLPHGGGVVRGHRP
jgi:hypothetical protein